VNCDRRTSAILSSGDLGEVDRSAKNGGAVVRNAACVGEFERRPDLDALLIGSGSEHVEYEPGHFRD
jgi:TATA-box binding protein (TBP) (component of TFIID and TFIIIB)